LYYNGIKGGIKGRKWWIFKMQRPKEYLGMVNGGCFKDYKIKKEL
jgi:hypothetical protein